MLCILNICQACVFTFIQTLNTLFRFLQTFFLMVQPWACQRVHDPSPCRLYRCTLPIIILWFRLDAAGCPMLLIFLPSFIISLCSPGLKLLPETQSALPLRACLEGRVLVGQHAVPKELLYLSLPPPSERVTSRAAGYIELLRHATCSTWRSGPNSCLCLPPAGTRSQVVFPHCRTKMNKLERLDKLDVEAEIDNQIVE